MNLAVLRILFFACIPIGIWLFIKGIKMVHKVFNTNILAEIKLSDENVSFEITKSGKYAIWIKAPAYQKNYLDKIKVVIYNQDRQQYMNLQYNFLSSQFTRSNNGSNGKMKLLTFKAEAGNYKMELVEGSHLDIIQKGVGAILPTKYADINKCFFQVRETTSWYYGFLGVLAIIFGIGSAIAGFVLGLLTNKIWG